MRIPSRVKHRNRLGSMGTQGMGEGSEQMLTEPIGGGLLRRVSMRPVETVVTTSHTKANESFSPHLAGISVAGLTLVKGRKEMPQSDDLALGQLSRW